MGAINLTNSKGRDAVVTTESVHVPLRVRWVDATGRPARPVRVLRATADRDLPALVRQAGSVDAVADLLVAGDPEVDLERYGAFLGATARVYVDPDGTVVHRVQEEEVVRSADGSPRERRPRQPLAANVRAETPLRWGKKIPKAEAVRRFVFETTEQLVHVNGLTYDFLYGISRELEAEGALLLLRAPGAKGRLVFHRGGVAYHGLLEGRTDRDRYCLLLHLSSMELAAPRPAAPADVAAGGGG